MIASFRLANLPNCGTRQSFPSVSCNRVPSIFMHVNLNAAPLFGPQSLDARCMHGVGWQMQVEIETLNSSFQGDIEGEKSYCCVNTA